MSFDEIVTGCVIRYPYLWVRESQRDETEGRKRRPVAVGLRIVRPSGRDVLLLFAITSQAPQAHRLAVEIPEAERRRAGLDVGRPLWIILDEYNQDIVGQSFHLAPERPVGRFSKAFFLPVLKLFAQRREQSKRVNRT